MMQCFEVLTEDKPGVLARVTGVVGARGENIAHLVASPARTGLSRIIVLVEMSPVHAEYVRRKLMKIVTVVSAEVHVAEEHVFAAFDLQPARTIDRAMWPAIELSRRPSRYAFYE